MCIHSLSIYSVTHDCGSRPAGRIHFYFLFTDTTFASGPGPTLRIFVKPPGCGESGRPFARARKFTGGGFTGLDASCVHVRLMPSPGPNNVTLTLEGCMAPPSCPLAGTFKADSESDSDPEIYPLDSDPEL
jgi:hypothetical protein